MQRFRSSEIGSVFLVSPSGDVQFSFGINCDGRPCIACPGHDIHTEKNAVRFLSHCKGTIRLVMKNHSIEPACAFMFYKADLLPNHKWKEDHTAGKAINYINCLERDESYVLERDESTGCAMLVEPMHDAAGRLVRDAEVVAQNLQRTKWILHVMPATTDMGESIAPNLALSKWIVCDSSIGNLTLCVKTSKDAPLLMTIENGSTVATLKQRLSKKLNVNAEDQLLKSDNGSILLDSEMIHASQLDTVKYIYFASKKVQLEGPRVWMFVENPLSLKKFATYCKPSDNVYGLLKGLGEQCKEFRFLCKPHGYALFYGSKLLTGELSLADSGLNNLSCLSFKDNLSSEPLLSPHDLILGSKLYVRTLWGKTLCFHFPLETTVLNLKTVIECLEDIPIPQQRLIFKGRCLTNEKTLFDYEVTPASVLTLACGLIGGTGTVAVQRKPLLRPWSPISSGDECVLIGDNLAIPSEGFTRAANAVVGRIVAGKAVPRPRSVASAFKGVDHLKIDLQFEIYIDE